MKLLQDLSATIASLLDPVLPKTVRCVIVLVDTVNQDVCAVSDLTDDKTKRLLEEAIQVLEDPDVSSDIELDIRGNQSLN